MSSEMPVVTCPSRRSGTGRCRYGFAAAIALLAAVSTATTWAFFEEPELPDDRNESTIHYSLVGALATCAGYEELAYRVATYDQLTDLGIDPSYDGTLCEGWVPAPPPNPVAAAVSGAILTDLVDGVINGCASYVPLTFPNDEKGHDPACFANRFRGTAHFFHFPNDDRLERLREWAFTPNVPLYGDIYAAYGGFTALPMTWRCVAEWLEQPIDTGPITSDSLEALGIYLHSMADHASHFDCIEHTESDEIALNIPTHYGQWGTSYCSFFEHYQELEGDESELDEAPLSRTLESAVGHEAMLWLYDGIVPHDQPYDFSGIYGELLAWRGAHPDLFVGKPDPIPADLDNIDYQEIMEMVQGMIVGNAGEGGRYNGMYRIEDADDIAAFCHGIQGL